MKNKSLTFCLAICLMLPCILLLGGCGGNLPDNPHTHTWSTTWSKDSSYHWHTCLVDGCQDVKDKQTHNFSDGSCLVCNYIQGSTPSKPSLPIVFRLETVVLI